MRASPDGLLLGLELERASAKAESVVRAMSKPVRPGHGNHVE